MGGLPPEIAVLLPRLKVRDTVKSNKLWWWEPGVTGYQSDGTPVYASAGPAA